MTRKWVEGDLVLSFTAPMKPGQKPSVTIDIDDHITAKAKVVTVGLVMKALIVYAVDRGKEDGLNADDISSVLQTIAANSQEILEMGKT